MIAERMMVLVPAQRKYSVDTTEHKNTRHSWFVPLVHYRMLGAPWLKQAGETH
jgi:hypothetical protein